VADFVAAVERAGFDYVWMPDSQLVNRDVWVALGLAAAKTSRIGLGTGVTNPITRDATVTASAAASLDELCGGRFVLGLGSGHSSVRVMGWKTARLARLREYIELMRPLWEGQFIAPYGRSFRLYHAPGRRIPIYLSATGPNMLQLAGEVADGVLLMAGVSKESLEYGLTNLEIGANRAGRRLEDLDVAVGTFSYLSDNWRADQRLVRPYAANFAIRHRDALRDSGVSVPDAQDESGVYPDLIHAEDWKRAIEVSSWVPDEVVEEFAEKFCLIGTAAEVAAKIRTLAGYGVTNLFIRGLATYELPTDLAEAYGGQVIPLFR
jgi:5,10-methylenetetrahydromethanopterin reductase